MAKSRSEGMFANSTFPCVLCVHGRFSLNLKEIMYKAGVLESLAGTGAIGVYVLQCTEGGTWFCPNKKIK